MSASVPVGWICIRDGATAPAAIVYTPACPKCGTAMTRIGSVPAPPRREALPMIAALTYEVGFWFLIAILLLALAAVFFHEADETASYRYDVSTLIFDCCGFLCLVGVLFSFATAISVLL